MTQQASAADERLPRAWLDYGRLYFARILGQIVGTLLTVLSARVLLPAGRGDFAALSAAAVLGAQALNLGLSSALAVLFARRQSRIGRYRVHLAWLALVWAAVLATLGGVHLWLRGAGPLAGWPLLAAWVPLQLLGLYQGAALVALQDAKWLSRIELLGRCCALVLGASSLVVFGAALAPFVAAVVAGDAVIAALGAARLARISRARPVPPSRALPFLKSAFRLGLRAYPPLVLFFLLVKSDILLLRLLRGPAETGVYSVAAQIVDVALILPTTIGALSLASVVRSPRPAAELLRVLRPTALVVFGLALGMLVLGRPAILLLFGDPFAGAYAALLLLVPGFVCLALQSVLGQYFAARGFPAALSWSWLVGFAVNIALNLLFVPRYGYLAAAASSSVAYALVFALLWRSFRRDEAGGASR